MDAIENKINSCKICGGPASGFKCEICGCEAEDKEHATHVCGQVHCYPKCVGCDLPESNCTCKPN